MVPYNEIAYCLSAKSTLHYVCAWGIIRALLKIASSKPNVQCPWGTTWPQACHHSQLPLRAYRKLLKSSNAAVTLILRLDLMKYILMLPDPSQGLLVKGNSDL